MQRRQLHQSPGRFEFINIGMFIPDWVVPSNSFTEHQAAMRQLTSLGGMAADNVAVLSLKGSYAWTFVNSMKSPLVGYARAAGYSPLYVLKNCLLQKNKFHASKAAFSTINLKPKSYLVLVGFWKNNGPNQQPSIVSMTNSERELLMLA